MDTRMTRIYTNFLVICNRHGYAGIAVILNGVCGVKNPRLAQWRFFLEESSE